MLFHLKEVWHCMAIALSTEIVPIQLDAKNV